MANHPLIRNPDECVAAVKRIEALRDAVPGSQQAQELEALAAAVRFYEDSIAMTRGVGRKASKKREQGVASTKGEE